MGYNTTIPPWGESIRKILLKRDGELHRFRRKATLIVAGLVSNAATHIGFGAAAQLHHLHKIHALRILVGRKVQFLIVKFFHLPYLLHFAIELYQGVIIYLKSGGYGNRILRLHLRIKMPSVLNGSGHVQLISLIIKLLGAEGPANRIYLRLHTAYQEKGE